MRSLDRWRAIIRVVRRIRKGGLLPAVVCCGTGTRVSIRVLVPGTYRYMLMYHYTGGLYYYSTFFTNNQYEIESSLVLWGEVLHTY